MFDGVGQFQVVVVQWCVVVVVQEELVLVVFIYDVGWVDVLGQVQWYGVGLWFFDVFGVYYEDVVGFMFDWQVEVVVVGVFVQVGCLDVVYGFMQCMCQWLLVDEVV